MGTTLDKPLHYVTSTHILACTSLHFNTNFTHPTRARHVFGAVVEEKFYVDIDNSAIRYYSGIVFLLLFYYTSACNLVFVVCLCV